VLPHDLIGGVLKREKKGSEGGIIKHEHEKRHDVVRARVSDLGDHVTPVAGDIGGLHVHDIRNGWVGDDRAGRGPERLVRGRVVLVHVDHPIGHEFSEIRAILGNHIRDVPGEPIRSD